MIRQRDTAMQSINVSCNVPETAVPSVFRVLWHSASSIQIEHFSPVQSWSALTIINADEQNMTRLNIISITHDTALFPVSDIQLTSLSPM